ncbi:MAG: DEAD/DEAH box helicase family protein [Methylococcaceae bacterium]
MEGNNTETEDETRSRHIYPEITKNWKKERIREQFYISEGRIRITHGKGKRDNSTIKYADYILEISADVPIAVVEAKRWGYTAESGLQQAKVYAQKLDIPFAYATNGQKIIEYDFLTHTETVVLSYPTLEQLKLRWQQHKALSKALLEPTYQEPKRKLRYYQQLAVNRAVAAISEGQNRLLLCMATGTGKTTTAFQICWKLFNSCWNKDNSHRKPKILFLADRDVLVSQPYNKDFAAFNDARHRIESGEVIHSREMYFAIYQAIAEDKRREGLFKQYPQDFFDLIVVDECHRGSAKDDSNWRNILAHFSSATQLGMTATPASEESKNTYDYFGKALYQYSLKEAIQDGYLAPYRLKRIVTDTEEYQPKQGELDKNGRQLPQQKFTTPDFDKILIHEKRTQAVAQHLSNYLRHSNPLDKTIIFCVNQPHAERMRRELHKLNKDLAALYGDDYICRITSDEGTTGKGLLAQFQDIESRTPVIVTTSEMLTTGVDAPTVKNVVIMRSVGNMTTFKQIIGRGTRLEESKNKLFFTVLDYTGWASSQFKDPDFNGEPDEEDEEDFAGRKSKQGGGNNQGGGSISEPYQAFVVEGKKVEIKQDIDSQLGENGIELETTRYTDFGEYIRQLYPKSDNLKQIWLDHDFNQQLLEQGIDLDELIEQQKKNAPDTDLFDYLCHLAWNQKLLTRSERVKLLKKKQPDLLDKYGTAARVVIEKLLEEYQQKGLTELNKTTPELLKAETFQELGNSREIYQHFDNPQQLTQAIQDIKTSLYS